MPVRHRNPRLSLLATSHLVQVLNAPHDLFQSADLSAAHAALDGVAHAPVAQLQGEVDELPVRLPHEVPDQVGVVVRSAEQVDLVGGAGVVGGKHPLHGHLSVVERA